MMSPSNNEIRGLICAASAIPLKTPNQLLSLVDGVHHVGINCKQKIFQYHIAIVDIVEQISDMYNCNSLVSVT
jgi:hypothetical protein